MCLIVLLSCLLQVREKHGPSLRERGSPDYSQTAADEREAILNTSHKAYIERSLAVSGAKTICQQR